MDPTVQAKIDRISQNHANPNWAAGRMLEVIKENVKLVNRTTQTMLLRELVRKKIPLKDVTSIEIRQRWNGRGKKDLRLIEFLMSKKLRSAQAEEKLKRSAYRKAKDRLYRQDGGHDESNLPAGWRLNRRSNMAVKFQFFKQR